MSGPTILKLIILLEVITLVILMDSCKHEPFIEMDNDLDMTDTIQVDTCDRSIIYFDQQILPILKGNCAQSGCHDANTAQNNVILENYMDVLSSDKITAGDLEESKIYERITEDDPDKQMPPLPANKLTDDQISLIAQWILEGGQNIECAFDITSITCNIDDVSFKQIIEPAINNNCRTCHSGNSPQANISLDSYELIKEFSVNGNLLAAISWDVGFPNMPQGGEQLDSCLIAQFVTWIGMGAPNN